jgi:hypothetical protein
MATLHDRFCEGLKALGMKRIASRNKYTMFQSAVPHYYFVGSAGALRVGSRPNAALSNPCSQKFKDKVLAAPTAKVDQQFAAAGIEI